MAALTGLRVAIGRPQQQAAAQIDLFARAGAVVLALPLLEIRRPDDRQPLLDAADNLAAYDLVVFVSPTAIDQAMPVLLAKRNWPEQAQPAVVGRGSAAALRRWVALEPLLPHDGSDSEALLRRPELQALSGKRVLILRGNGGRELLAGQLRQRGAHVDIVEAYRRVLPATDISPLFEPGPTVLLATSSEALSNLLQLAGESRRQSLQSLVIFAIHQRIADHARSLGFARVLTTAAADQALLDDVSEWYAHEKESMTNVPDPAQPDNPPVQEPLPAVPPPPETGSALVATPAWWRHPASWVAAGALLAVGVQWQQMRQQIAALQLEAGSFNKESRSVAERNTELTRQLQTKLAVLESKFNDTQSQQLALQAMYQELSRGSEETSLADVEQALELADQQLQLAGNVRVALIALQNIDQKLQGNAKPQWIAIRRAVSADAETLKKAPFVDTVGISVRIDTLVAAVDKLPLVVEKPQPRSATQPAAAPEQSWLARIGGDIWRDIKDLIRVRRLERQEPLLLSPEQSFFLRENLKLRLLDARMANIQRDGTTFAADIRAARSYIERYFDSSSSTTRRFADSLNELSQTEIAVQTPTLARSLTAVRDAKLSREKVKP